MLFTGRPVWVRASPRPSMTSARSPTGWPKTARRRRRGHPDEVKPTSRKSRPRIPRAVDCQHARRLAAIPHSEVAEQEFPEPTARSIAAQKPKPRAIDSNRCGRPTWTNIAVNSRQTLLPPAPAGPPAPRQQQFRLGISTAPPAQPDQDVDRRDHKLTGADLQQAVALDLRVILRPRARHELPLSQ